MDIHDGTFLACATAGGGEVTMRALGPVVQGVDFPVVWVCVPAEYEQAGTARNRPGGIPWPLTAVHVIEDDEPSGTKVGG